MLMLLKVIAFEVKPLISVQLWQECMSAAVNVLKSDPKISNHTKRHQKQLNLFDINMKFA